MSIRAISVMSMTGLSVAALVALAGITTPSAAQRGGTPRGTAVDVFCPNNRVSNGQFSTITPGTFMNDSENISGAPGWTGPWQQHSNPGSGLWSTADLYTGIFARPYANQFAPIPNQGNYAAFWNTNSPTQPRRYREGILNRLDRSIIRSEGRYQLSFDIATPLTRAYITAPSVIGIYGVRIAPNAGLPPGPASVDTPANLDLYGPNAAVLLGSVVAPMNLNNNWQPVAIQFNSTLVQRIEGMTHLLITKLDGAPSPVQNRYLAFDNFCLQTLVEAGIASDEPATPANAQ